MKQIKISKRTLVSVIYALLLGIFSFGCMKKQEVYHVGILSGIDAFADTADGFMAGLGGLGYIEGKNILYDLQSVNVDVEGERRIAGKFIKDKVDLIFAFPTSAVVAAKTAAKGKGIPVIFANAGIEGNDLVEDIRRPGGGITGVRFPSAEITLKRLEFLHEFAPGAKQIYIAYDTGYPGINHTLMSLRRAAPLMNLILVEAPITNLGELKKDLEARAEADSPGIDAILIMPTLLTAGPRGFPIINRFASVLNLPVGGSTENNAIRGALFSYIPENVEMGRLAAILADKVLKGTDAGIIPVVTPEAYLYINYTTLERLGLSVSNSLMSQAVEIFRDQNNN